LEVVFDHVFPQVGEQVTARVSSKVEIGGKNSQLDESLWLFEYLVLFEPDLAIGPVLNQGGDIRGVCEVYEIEL